MAGGRVIFKKENVTKLSERCKDLTEQCSRLRGRQSPQDRKKLDRRNSREAGKGCDGRPLGPL